MKPFLFLISLLIYNISTAQNFDDGLLDNGDFELGSQSWIRNLDDNQPANIIQDNQGNHHYYVSVTNTGVPWDENLTQKLDIPPGEVYTLFFEAWSNDNRSIVAGIGQYFDCGWNTDAETIDITTTKTLYSVVLNSYSFSCIESRVLFDLGDISGDVFIDNVALFSGEVTNQAPVANDVSVNVASEISTSIGLDANDDFTSDLIYEIVDAPTNGIAILNNNNIVEYTPSPGHIGSDSFTYRAYDREFYSNEATVQLNVIEAPNLSVSLNTTDINEGETAILTAVLDSPSDIDVTIDLSHISGTASFNDYQISVDGVEQTQLIILAGETSVTAQISIIEDDIYETQEFILFNLLVDGAGFQQDSLKLTINGNAAILTTIANGECYNFSNGSDFRGTVVEIFVDGSLDFSDTVLEFGDPSNIQSNSVDLSSFGTLSNQFVYVVIYQGSESNFVNEFHSINESNSIETVSSNWIEGNFSFRIKKTDQTNPMDQYGVVCDDCNWQGEWSIHFSFAKRKNQTGPDFGYNSQNWDIGQNEALYNSGLCNGNTTSFEDIIGGLGTYSSENQPPVSDDISIYTLINNPVQIELTAEDNFQSNLSYSLVSNPTNGGVILNGNIVTYTPEFDFEGEDTFTFKAFDGEFYSNVSTVTVAVTHIPDITLTIDTNEIAEHEAAIITATLDAPGPYDVEIDLSSIEGTASEDDFIYVSSNGGGTRYIKFEAYYSSDDGQVNLAEIKALLADGTNVACGKLAHANSPGGWSNSGTTSPVYSATDCEANSRWSSERNDPGPSEIYPHYITVDLGEIYMLDRIELLGDQSGWDMSFSVLVSHDGETWRNVGAYDNYFLGSLILTDLQQDNFLIKSGETTTTIYVQGIEDNVTEGTETLTINTPVVENANLLNPQAFSVDILDVVTTFTLIDDMFDGFSSAEFAWGDYDADGDMDVAIMGDQGGSGLKTLLYTNEVINGDHTFTDSEQNFEQLGYGTLKWVDIDKDGLIDLFVSGIGQSGIQSLVYINNTDIDDGVDFILDESYEFPDLFRSDIDFGDLDNDGDVDYAINGTTAEGQQVSYYGFQNSDNSFEIINSNFGTFDGGSIKIFDVNSDGDNDVITSANARINSFFSNNTNGIYPTHNFEELDFFMDSSSNSLNYMTIGNNGEPSTLTGLNNHTFENFVNGDFTIADYNNDGFEDIFITGSNVNDSNPSDNEVSSILYQNDNGQFSPSTEFIFQGFTNSSTEWVDFDNDGDLDLFLAGKKIGEGNKTYMYEVEITNKKNSAPEKILNLNFNDLGNGNIRLEWDAPTDDFNAILGYNLRLGTSPGGDELSYLLSEQDTGQLMVNQLPSILTNAYSIQLDPGVYYWSVQAVDKGFKGGEFSDEQTFTLTYDWKILNQGGIIDRSISAVNNPMLEFLDLDNNGSYDLLYGQSGSQLQVYSYANNLLSSNQNYSLNNSLDELEISDLNLDGSFDIIGKRNLNENIIFMSSIDNDIITFSNNDFNTNSLYDREQRVADFNNDGNIDILNFGLDNQDQFLANFKLYSSSYNSESGDFSTIELSESFSSDLRLFSPSFDIGDFDNDQDIDVVISGDLIFGGYITKIFENTTETGTNNFSFEEFTEAQLPGIYDGSTDFIDFDSDGDLDLLISGFNEVGNKVFSMHENVGESQWPEIETNLPEMTDTQLDFGDFNADGFSDLLISGIDNNDNYVTLLMEYEPGVGFIESDYDLSEFSNAKFAFGDLDGDTDLDFVIAGTSAVNSQNLIRVYLNYRSDSYNVLNAGSRLASNSSNVFNEAPSKPTIDSISIESINSENIPIVKIEWSQSSDDNTPDSAITYALKIGTSSQSEDIISSAALPSGQRKISGNGNSEYNLSWDIALPPGDYFASVQSIDASFLGSEFSDEYSFTINQDNTMSINDFSYDLVKIYPNPTNSTLNILNNDNGNEIVEVNLYDIVGKRYNLNIDKNSLVDLSSLSVGVYILEIIFDNKQVLKRKVIRK